MSEVLYNAMVLREPYSGVEHTVYQLAKALATYTTLNLHITTAPRQRPLPATPHLTHTTSPLGSTRIGRILWEQTILPLILYRKNIRLLHAPAYVAPRLLPCPMVATIHDLHIYTHPHFCTPANRAHYRLLLPSTLKHAKALIVFSDYTRRTITTLFPSAAPRITLIPPGINPIFKPITDNRTTRTLRHKLNLPQDFLLFVGDLSQRKNISGILQSFAQLAPDYPNLSLVLTGHSSPAITHLVTQYCAQHQLHNRIILTGYLPDTDLPTIYSLATAFIFPSHDEGFGLPPLEAMACGTPVVCSGGAVPENCGNAALTCQPDDPTSIATALRRLLEDPNLCHDLTTRGLALSAELTWQNAALKTAALYRNTLKSQPTS